MDGLPNVITTQPSTRIYFPRDSSSGGSSNSSPKKNNARHETALGFGFVNEAGSSGFKRTPYSFPVGTVIVRERLWVANGKPDQLVVMIKRPLNFNRKANGWEFLTVNGEATKVLKREKDGKCLQCHQEAARDDFVFPMKKR